MLSADHKDKIISYIISLIINDVEYIAAEQAVLFNCNAKELSINLWGTSGFNYSISSLSI